ncbi:MAG TPA: hypothetical protein ENG95_02485 [Nitrospirae bacterium]|nr:hypothetical protein [Nitrospirota bacterium]
MGWKREEQTEATKEEAKLILSEKDYSLIIEAIKREKETMFIYNKLSGGTWLYRSVKPTGFVFTGEVYLWAYHKIHHRGHSFRAWEISSVYVYGNIIEAIINPGKYKRFWNGLQASITTLPR